jgi:hypothetical protein
MGAWGYGTWDGDAALDYLGDYVHRLKREIEKNLRANSRKVDVINRPVLAGVAMLRALIVGTGKRYFLARSKAVAWRDQYLAWFDQPEVQDCHQHPERFRKEAVKEFRRLIACADPSSETEELEESLDEEQERVEAEKRKPQKRAKRR